MVVVSNMFGILTPNLGKKLDKNLVNIPRKMNMAFFHFLESVLAPPEKMVQVFLRETCVCFKRHGLFLER